MAVASRRLGDRRLLSRQRSSLLTSLDVRPASDIRRKAWFRTTVHLALVAALLCLAAANVSLRWTWSEVEDGVLWRDTEGVVTAVEIAEESPAARGGIQPGDALAALNDTEVRTAQQVKIGRAHV